MSADTTRPECDCRPRWAGHVCTVFTPAEQALADHLNAYGSTVLYDGEVKEAVAVVRPVLYREAAQSLRVLLDGLLPIDDRTMGLRYAATRLERTAQDLEDEGGTDA